MTAGRRALGGRGSNVPLTLVATFAGFRNFSSEERQRFIDLRKKPLVEEGKEPKDIAPVVARTLIGPSASEDKLQRLVRSMERLHKESYVKTIEASTLYDKALELETVKVPTCLVFGEHDSLTTPETGKAMADRIAGSELHVVPRSGHLINIEEPETFNRIVMDFLLANRG
jgi:3-oxoadipate enol-lactonase